MRRLAAYAVIVMLSALLHIAESYGASEEEHLINHPAKQEVLTQFLDRYGYRKHQVVAEEDYFAIGFFVEGPSEKTFRFSLSCLPAQKVLSIACHDLVQTPDQKDQYQQLIEGLTRLNGIHSIGKYALDTEGTSVRYFYYRTVESGISFADFRKTLATIEKIVFDDYASLRDLALP